jgi:hypothetical protein
MKRKINTGDGERGFHLRGSCKKRQTETKEGNGKRNSRDAAEKAVEEKAVEEKAVEEKVVEEKVVDGARQAVDSARQRCCSSTRPASIVTTQLVPAQQVRQHATTSSRQVA